MKVLFDHQIFSLQKYGGVSKYFVEILRNIPKENWDTTVSFSNNEYIKDKKIINHYRIFPNKIIKGSGRITNEINKLFSIPKLVRGNFDILHQTHYQTYSFPYIKNKQLVTTFHDMNFYRYNHPDLKIQKKSVMRADKIIAISNNTKNELVETWNISEDKIKVIYHGVDKPLEDILIGERLIREPYLLYVGLRSGYKNFKNFASVFSVIKKKFPELKLVCTGLPFISDEINLFKKLSILDSIIQMSASEIEMANLYNFAELFIYPSFYEGFGMPILEALSYQCPTIVSNTSCFPEIAKDSAFYFDPYDNENMIYEIIKLLEDNELRHSKKLTGLIRCKDFTWEKCAKEHFELYKSMI